MPCSLLLDMRRPKKTTSETEFNLDRAGKGVIQQEASGYTRDRRNRWEGRNGQNNRGGESRDRSK